MNIQPTQTLQQYLTSQGFRFCRLPRRCAARCWLFFSRALLARDLPPKISKFVFWPCTRRSSAATVSPLFVPRMKESVHRGAQPQSGATLPSAELPCAQATHWLLNRRRSPHLTAVAASCHALGDTRTESRTRKQRTATGGAGGGAGGRHDQRTGVGVRTLLRHGAWRTHVPRSAWSFGRSPDARWAFARTVVHYLRTTRPLLPVGAPATCARAAVHPMHSTARPRTPWACCCSAGAITARGDTTCRYFLYGISGMN
eukprot:COSAG02_NODE_31_length_50774_cov_1928.118204_32_plen_257_part_00